MISIPINTRVGSDGTIILKAPAAFFDKQIEAFLVVQPVFVDNMEKAELDKWRDELCSLSGCIADESFIRGLQGEYEVREAI